MNECLLHLSTGSSRTVLDPTGTSNTGDAGSLANVFKIFLSYGTQAKSGNICSRNGPSLTINHIDNSGGRLNSQSTWPNNAVFQSAAHDHSLLVILIIENRFHGGSHQNLEEERGLILGISSSDRGDDSQALQSTLLHLIHDNLGSIGKHGVSNILGLSSESDDDTVYRTSLKHLGHIGGIGDVSLDHREVVICQAFPGLGPSRPGWDYELVGVSGQSNDAISVLKSLVYALGRGES
mmetsp:Transcript_3829/g.5760  ORF Transcript_3829/g.5760 Transcript_3829/m.5760 type:complete len:237 (-) Transcript_3829:218-928(-)